VVLNRLPIVSPLLTQAQIEEHTQSEIELQAMTTDIHDPPALAMIHTVPGIIPVFNELVGLHLPGWRPFNMLDESLLGNTIREGTLSRQTMRRLATHIWSAVDAGASAVLVTCSSLGPAVDAAMPLCPVPIFRIDDGMAIEAIQRGNRIGVLATLATTMNPTTRLIERHAHRMGHNVFVTSRLCEGAFDKLRNGDRAAHDAMIREGLASIVGSVDVVVLAQASMANALNEMSEISVPVLTSPKLGVLHMSSALNARSRVQESAQS
jgi:Asp/Glu/hydantoin racemase